MFDLIIRAHTTALVICQTEAEQSKVILDAVMNGFDWDVPTHSSDVAGLEEFDADVWLAV